MIRKTLLSLVLCGAFATVQADIIPSFVSATPSDGQFAWTYSAHVTLDQMVVPGDFFTIYDFAGTPPMEVSSPPNWTFSSSLIGQTPPNVIPLDDPILSNLTWTYTGVATIPGPSELGEFSVLASTDVSQNSNFAAQGTKSTGPEAGTKIENVGLIPVPIPEPGTWQLLGAGGVAGILSLLRRRKKA